MYNFSPNKIKQGLCRLQLYKGHQDVGLVLPDLMFCVAGVERKVVVKGRAAVDAHCPIAKHSHVYEDEDDDTIWDCMLNQVCGLGRCTRI